MKLIIFGLIIISFGALGYQLKLKYKKQKETLLELKSFLEFMHLNISIYKNNIDEIIKMYLIQQNNKNAKYINNFLKNNILGENNTKNIENNLYNENIKLAINTYFSNLGKSDLKGECDKCNSLLGQLECWIKETENDLKTKGELFFKIMLAIGVVVVIILW